MFYLDFEEKLEKFDVEIQTLTKISKDTDIDIDKKIKDIERKKQIELKRIYSNLSPWQIVKLARHPNRPKTKNFINSIFTDFTPLYGDRLYSEDNAIISGLAFLDNLPVVILGTEKGNDMNTRIKHNFGMAKPEGYRKAQRLLLLAEKFQLPVVTFVDTAGAFPGKDAEERGQSESIASSILAFLKVKIPTISIIIGEGGSGGAIGIAASDRVLMLEHSTYSVISPEGCASILWRSTNFSREAANTLKLTAEDCKKFKIIDEIIPELPGGAHRNPKTQSDTVKSYIMKSLNELETISLKELVKFRKDKYLNITSDI